MQEGNVVAVGKIFVSGQETRSSLRQGARTTEHLHLHLRLCTFLMCNSPTYEYNDPNMAIMAF